MPLLELIADAKKCTFVKVTKPFNEYTEDEIHHAVINEVLKNDVVVYSLILACKKYSAVKIIIKMVLKGYIEAYSITIKSKKV